LISGPARLVSLTANQFTIAAASPGQILLRVRYTPDWRIIAGDGCLTATTQGWTSITVTRAETLRVAARLLPATNRAC
jgi:hypothetical protein